MSVHALADIALQGSKDGATLLAVPAVTARQCTLHGCTQQSVADTAAAAAGAPRRAVALDCGPHRHIHDSGLHHSC